MNRNFTPGDAARHCAEHAKKVTGSSIAPGHFLNGKNATLRAFHNYATGVSDLIAHHVAELEALRQTLPPGHTGHAVIPQAILDLAPLIVATSIKSV